MDIIDVVEVQKVGSSLYFLASAKLLKRVTIKEGDTFILTLDNGKIVYIPKALVPAESLPKEAST